MRHNTPVTTLAAALALALALLLGVLLPSDGTVHAQVATQTNRPPEFAAETDTRSIEENTPPGVSIGVPVSATDPDEDGEDADDREFGETLTYSLEGADADSFNLDPLTGQLSTRAVLDFEADNEYSVTVRVRDSRGATGTITVRISVTNDSTEPPFAPPAPTVVSGPDDTATTDTNESTTSLKVVWHPPENMGDRTITRYSYRYRSTTAGTWSDPVAETGTTATITDLVANTTYLVSVRATSAEGTSPWSLSGTGSTNRTGNSPPTFGTTTLFEPSVPENSPGGQNVDLPIMARDSDTGSLSYRLEGPDAAMFDFITSSGQIRTKRGVTYNHEDPGCGYVDALVGTTACTHYVTVAAYDGAGGSDAVRVQIGVSDRPETPSKLASPTVRATERTITSLDVNWREPANAGPPITSYNVQYRRRGSSDNFSSGGVPDTVAGTATTISGINDDAIPPAPWLQRGTRYEVRVQAVNGEGSNLWSDPGTGSTNLGNLDPVFRDRPPSGEGSTAESALSLIRTMDENTSPGRPVDKAVAARDGNADKLTYRLTGDDAALFDIDESSGQIRTTRAGVPYNYEDLTPADNPCTGFDEQRIRTDTCYTVTVQVRDGLNENKERVEEPLGTPDDSVTVVIGVRDVREPPDAPALTVTSPTDMTNLVLTWDEPENTGPDISGYDVEYRQGSGSWLDDNCRGAVDTDDNCDDILAVDTTTTITGLVANTSYSVRVRATNDEGDSAWTTVTGRTNRNRPSRPGDTPTPNVAPSFSGESPTLQVPENTSPAQNIGSAISPDAENEGDRLTYSLEGADRNSFSIDRNTGQIKTRARLNHEEKSSYMVRVKVVDGQGGSASQNVTIVVTNVVEPPSAPAPPKVTATRDSGLSLEVTWNEPQENTGPAITDYDIQSRVYRPSSESQETYVEWPHADTERSATIMGLDPRTAYEVQVRAKNGEGDDTTQNWSNPTRGTTGASNTRPAFEDTSDVVTLNVDENTQAGQDVGSPVSARDDDGHRLTYSLDGPDASSFDINGSTGWIRTRSGVSYDYELKSSYSVTVKVDDRQRKTNSVTAKSVTIELRDVDEPPSAPKAPRVAGVPGSTDSIRVTWDEPANTGPPIDYYDVQYGEAGTGGFVQLGLRIEDSSVIITGLTPGTRYDVQVRAWNDEGRGEYSRSGTGAPNADIRNRNPRFTGGTRSFSVEENTDAGVVIGVPVEAIDDDDDPLSYSLAGTDAVSFDIDAVSGQIRTREALNFEAKTSHSVTVRARDNRGGSGTVDVRITVTDVDEPPDTPDAPTVTALSSSSLQVSWDAPENAGPPITDYDYRYRGPAGDWTEVINTTIKETTVTIEGLTASTFYDVSVRAKNAEGTSEWSNSGFGSTNDPGANNPPVFSEGANATRSVSAGAPSGTLIGDPVAAADADSGDTVTYRLEGRDAPSFDINETNGQLRTKSGITLIVGTTYTVTVVADDGRDTARIEVSIEATAAPPNNAPAFTEGASAARTVSASAPAGTSIGAALAATDADAGTTLTYSLEGADAASFGINSANGQLLTVAGVTLDRTTYTVEVVANDGITSSRITVTITVTPNRAPVFSEGANATRSVAENEPAGTNVGSPVVATDLNQGDTLTYTLDGADAGSFTIVPTSGQIRTNATLDYETKASYVVTVTATDRSLAADSIEVTISVIQVAVHDCSGRGAVADAASNRGLVSDCDALLSARNTLEGRARLDWSESTPIEQWEGVSISGTPMRVTRLNLMDRGLSGTIPDALGRLSMLTHLNLRSNPGLSGEIPDALGNLRNLRLLNLHSNSHTGAVPDLSGISGLEELYLANNADYDEVDGEKVKVAGSGLTGQIPTWLNGMTNMEELWLWGNSLTGSVPNLSGMTSLDKLKLANNNLTGGVPQASTLPPNMTWLIIDRNPFGGTIPNLSSLSRLRLLWLHSNQLTGSVPDGDNYPASLDDLNLRDNRLTGTIPDLSNLDNLTRLRLHNNSLSGEVPATLGDLDSLTQLWLHNEDATKTVNGNNSFTSIAAGVGDLADTLIEIALNGNPWNANACVPVALANVAKNDYTEAGIEVCSANDGS